MRELVKDIKQKKELKDLADSFVKYQLRLYLKKSRKAAEYVRLGKFNKKSVIHKLIVKEVRAQLRRLYGVFRGKIKKRDVIESHSSTKERFLFYEQLYKKLWEITGKPKIILDLGCGVNPFSIPFMKLKNLNYYAYDISKTEINMIDDYFSLLKKKNKQFNGKALILDILQMNKLRKLPHADAAFLFKMTDVIDQSKGHKKTEEVIKAIPARFVVVSFPTLTMSRKPMNHPRRKWIELLCERLGYSFKIFKFSNEMFYVIKKS